MPKMTLLEMTQNILSSMSSDPVASIGDTAESDQVAKCIIDSYNLLMAERDWPHLRILTKLSSIASPATNPTTLVMHDQIVRIEWLKHNTRYFLNSPRRMEDMIYLTPDEFLNYTTARNEVNNPNVTMYQDPINGLHLKIVTNRPPQYWTTFDDRHVVLDAFNSAIAASIIPDDTLCSGYRNPELPLSDSAVPDMPVQFFPVLLETARVSCFNTIKGEYDSLANREVKRQRVMLQHGARREEDAYKTGRYINKYRGINYGRT